MAQPARVRQADVFAPPRVKSVPVTDRPRDAEFAWLRAHAQEYVGQWVALDGANLLGAAPGLKDLLARMTPADRALKPLFHRVDTD